MSGEYGPAVGHCDGFRGNFIHGWAWYPERPDIPVEVELLIDGRRVGTTIANRRRSDLRKARIGDGCHGWHIPFPSAGSDGDKTVDVLVRAASGDTLIGGAFVAQVLDRPDAIAVAAPSANEAPARPLNIVLLSPGGADSASLGASEYSYGFAARAYRPVLEQLGTIHDITGQSERAHEIYAALVGRGEGAVVLSFFPPHRTPLDSGVPLVPMMAWEYPTLPDGRWSGREQDDWRFVLRQIGRAVVASKHSATAIRAVMGEAFPVAVIPHPVFDRMADAGPPSPRSTKTEIAIDGFVFDTRKDGITWLGDFGGPATTGRAVVTIDGVIVTSVFAPRDGRKAWQDSVTAFVDAHRETADATLVLKMIASDPSDWRWELHEILSRERPFACRLVVLHGYLEDAVYAQLIAASHWVSSATLAEGQCLPLLEFMSAGRPAITPAHTVMADYVTPANALVVDHGEERCAWPLDGTNRMTTARARLHWASLREAYRTAHGMVADDPRRLAGMGGAARATMRGYCSDAIVAERLDSFLGLNLGRACCPPAPSPLVGSLAPLS